MALRIGHYIEWQGLLGRDTRNSNLADDELEAYPTPAHGIQVSTRELRLRAGMR